MKAKKKIIEWRVDMDMKFSHEFIVRAKTKKEAKAKAMQKMQSIAKRTKQFNINIDKN